jgi:hypothetical protein
MKTPATMAVDAANHRLAEQFRHKSDLVEPNPVIVAFLIFSQDANDLGRLPSNQRCSRAEGRL